MRENMKAKRAAIYVRVSTNDQETDMQEVELNEYCENRSWSCTVYKDRGQSGAKNDRPAPDRIAGRHAKAKVRCGGGLGIGQIGKVTEAVAEHRRGMKSAGRGLGVAEAERGYNPARRTLTFQVLGAVAEFEREMLRERVRAGMAQAKRAGKRVGRPARRQFHSSDIERMKALRAKGISIRKLAADFQTTQWMAARLTSSSV
jgi:DNA invertase Pin-like site-specific DNA recombinase